MDKQINDLKIIPVACGLIFNNEKKILLIQRSKTDPNWPNMWEPPRGKVDKKNETIIQGLKREVKEETGLDVIPVKFIDEFQYVADDGKRISIQFNFLCRMKDPNQKIKLSFEHQNYKWVDKVGIIELMVAGPEILSAISKVLNDDYVGNQFYDVEEIEEVATNSKVDCVFL